MKIESKKLYNGPVNGADEIVITDMSKPELKKLTNALAIVEKYEELSLKTLNKTRKYADWTMLKYKLTKDGVKITVEQGACG